MDRLASLNELYAYNRWANDRLLSAVERIPQPGIDQDLGSSFPSIRATLLHMLAAEWLWLSRWQGVSPQAMPAEWADASLGELRLRWREIEEQQQAFLGQLREEGLDHQVEYRKLAGDRMQSTVEQMLRHVVNHATYHRGQVVTMMRQLGHSPPATDLILYSRTTRSAPA